MHLTKRSQFQQILELLQDWQPFHECAGYPLVFSFPDHLRFWCPLVPVEGCFGCIKRQMLFAHPVVNALLGPFKRVMKRFGSIAVDIATHKLFLSVPHAATKRYQGGQQ